MKKKGRYTKGNKEEEKNIINNRISYSQIIKNYEAKLMTFGNK